MGNKSTQLNNKTYCIVKGMFFELNRGRCIDLEYQYKYTLTIDNYKEIIKSIFGDKITEKVPLVFWKLDNLFSYNGEIFSTMCNTYRFEPIDTIAFFKNEIKIL